MSEHSDEDSKIHDLILKCNKTAMDNLKNNDFDGCVDLLKKAEKLLVHDVLNSRSEKSYRLLGITLNNLGCFYRRTGKQHVALRYLKKALEIEIYTLNDKVSVAGTHLNICVILSGLKRHKDAIKHARLAVDLLELSRESIVSDGKFSASSSHMFERMISSNEKLKNVMTTIVIAYFNLATEEEYLGMVFESLESFQVAVQYSSAVIGEEHPLTNTIRFCLDRVATKADELRERETIRTESKIKKYENGYNYYIRAKGANVFYPDLLNLTIPGPPKGKPPVRMRKKGRTVPEVETSNGVYASSGYEERSEEPPADSSKRFLPEIPESKRVKMTHRSNTPTSVRTKDSQEEGEKSVAKSEKSSRGRATSQVRQPASGARVSNRHAPSRDRKAGEDHLETVSYTHLRAHETPEHLVCRLLLEKKK
eukprot:TRINITY_DN4006_c0_g2_i7.p1 TRINITY_DN4006_c0_g2~~TRINITY_DN4006_c0_g2_i7.p1  ORF type:complete len:423 (+),score=97.76 TRINITY_DN4006_c0_g2_i7:58-1326(+)